MADNTNGVKPPTETSPASSSPAPAESNATTTSPASGEQTMADVARQAFESAVARESGEGAGREPTQTAEPALEGEPVVEPSSEAKPNEEPAKTEDGTEQTTAEPAKTEQSVPYARFTEVNEKAKEFETQVSALKPAAERWNYHQQFCQRFDIKDNEVSALMDYLAYKRTDPEKALQMLKAELGQLQEYDDGYIPADLKARAEQGEWGEHSDAVVKELAKLRREANREKGGRQRTEAQVAADREAAKANALTSWDLAKRGTDPDFKPKAKETDPDGLWELTAAKFSYLQTTRGSAAASPAEVVRNLEQAYTEAKRSMAALRPPPKNTRPLPSTSRSSSPSRREPATVDDVVADVVRGHGMSWGGRSNGEEE